VPGEAIEHAARPRMEETEAEDIRVSVEIPRSFNIRKTDLEVHGYTAGCLGCKAVLRGGSRQGHSAACRKRLMEAMPENKKVTEAQKREN